MTEDGAHRVFIRSRMYPGLKTSRTIGDMISHRIGVISEPEVNIIKPQGSDKYLVIGSEGLWDFLSHSQVDKIIGDMSVGQRESHEFISQVLWQNIKDAAKQEGNPLLDTTVIVANLQ